MRPAGLALLAFAGGIGLLAACSGADPQAVLTGQPSGGSTTTTSGGTTSGGTTSGGSVTCGNPEDEPNDTQDDANELDGEICGTISPKGDVDWLTFTLAPSAQSLQLEFAGQVRLRVHVNGSTTELTPDSANAVPFVRNAPYYIEVSAFTDSESDQAWSVTVIEK